MKKTALFWTMVISLVFPFICAETAQAKRIETGHLAPHPKMKEELWVVAQQTDSGKHYNICVSKDAIKFANGKFVVLSKAPDWQVSLLNQRARVFWTAPLDEFNGLKETTRYNVKKLSPVKIAADAPPESKEPKIAKQPVTMAEGDCQLSPETVKAIGFAPPKLRVASTTKVPIAPGGLKVLSKIIGIDGIEGVPLEIKATRKTEETIDLLQTQWCLNRELDKETFEIPKSYWKGKSFNDVETQNTVVTLRSQLKRHPVPDKKN